MVFIMCPMVNAQADNSHSFTNWLRVFKKEAIQKGISKKILDDAFQGVLPIKRVIELDRKQPEGQISFAQYKKNVLSEIRIKQGRELYRKHKKILDSVAEKYGVPAPYIVALWGIETSYGKNTGGFDIIPALATLAYDGRRSEFFRSELLDAFKILEEGHISLEEMKGSWAGAMGQNQFMPSSFHRYAVDEDGDGKRNIWTNLHDVFASTANYLHSSGWKVEERWGREVRLPKTFRKDLITNDVKRSLKEWDRMGVRFANGERIPLHNDMKASVVAPDGLNGQAFLVYNNFSVILKWNRSKYFAICVGMLADSIAAERI